MWGVEEGDQGSGVDFVAPVVGMVHAVRQEGGVWGALPEKVLPAPGGVRQGDVVAGGKSAGGAHIRAGVMGDASRGAAHPRRVGEVRGQNDPFGADGLQPCQNVPIERRERFGGEAGVVDELHDD